MDAIQLFLRQHAQVHTAALGHGEGSLADMVLRGLNDEHMRLRPGERLQATLAVRFWNTGEFT